MTTTLNQEECKCGGAIKNCLYCQGTGLVTAATKQQVDQLIAATRVLICSACGQQNRVRLSQLEEAQPIYCYTCTAPLLTQATRLLQKPKSGPK